MFKIEAFVEDKKLGEALKALAGLVRGMPSVVPVINVDEDANPAAPVRANGSGNLAQMLGSHLRHTHRTKISAQEIGQWLRSIGRSPQSASYVAKLAVDGHILRRAGGMTSGAYEVIAPVKARRTKKIKLKKPEATEPESDAS